MKTLFTLLLIAAVAAIGGAWWAARSSAPVAAAANDDHAHAQAETRYTCAMHPEVDLDAPGQCPICGMALIPRAPTPTELNDVPRVQVAPAMVQQLGIRTASVRQGTATSTVTTSAQLVADERRIVTVTARAEGWIETLHVNAVGDAVLAGQPLATLYAPDLTAAEEALALAKRLQDPALIAGAQQRLRHLGGGADAATLRAPGDGVVTALLAREGAEVGRGAPLMELTDFSRLWVQAELPQALTRSVAVGQRVEVRVPGAFDRPFSATVAAFEPTLTPDSRTIGVRLVVDNPEGRMRPGMLAQLRFQRDADADQLWIPTEALIRTGERTTVILAEDDGHFRPLQVVAGDEYGDETAILEGLHAGQQVVVSGQFLIDSEASLRGSFNRMGHAGHQP